MTYNQNPEQLARDQIDAQLRAAGWVVQAKTSINLHEGAGQAVREYPTDKAVSNSPQNSPPFQGGVPEGRGGQGGVAEGRGGSGVAEGRGGLGQGGSGGMAEGRGGSQLLERIRTERESRYQQQLDEWRTATADLEKHGKEGKKRAKPRQPKPVEPFSPEERAALPVLPEGWAWGKLGEAIVRIDAGKSFSCDERPPSINEIGVAKVSAVSWGEYNESESKTCKDKTKEIAEYIIEPGDFLLSRANTIDLVGACVIVKHTRKRIMLSDKTLRITLVTMTPEYVLQYLRSRTGRLEIMKRSTGNQESMRNIGQERVSAINIPFCSLPEQREIVRILEEQFAVIEQNEQEIDAALARAEALRQAILKKAFSGRLVPQDPNDEPASTLLERIRAERAAAPQSKPSRKPPKRKAPAGGVHP